MSDEMTLDALLRTLWGELGGGQEKLGSLSIHGKEDGLPSVYPVADFAAATIGLATLAVAEWASLARGESVGDVSVDRTHAAIAFRSERYLERPGQPWPPLWDSIAGDYPSRDGFIRLHTNYAHHRLAAERVLGHCDDRDELSGRIAKMSALELETTIVEAGGCAAAMRTPEEWQQHPQGSVVGGLPCIERVNTESSGPVRSGRTDEAPGRERPLEGVRVLDLTRVIAGPTCTRVLAAWGAEVLRIDPVGFEESDALLADTTVGKRCATLDLRDQDDRKRFEALVSTADILVQGYRSDALANLGYDAAALRARNSSLVITALDAYGFEGPWRTRRGFDSLVQMSCGIAARGQAVFGTKMPRPLPAQALDHGSGYLLAAAACRSLCDARAGRRSLDARLSLAGTARALMSMGENGDPECPEPERQVIERFLVEEQSAFGRIRRVACPGRIRNEEPFWARAASPIGNDDAAWMQAASAQAN